MIPTTQGPMPPESIISELTFATYRFNRDSGMSAEALGRLFPQSGTAMEERYLREHMEAAA